MFESRVLLWYIFQLLLQVLHLLILLKQLLGQLAKHFPLIVSHPFSLVVDELLIFLQLSVTLFEVKKSTSQPWNLVFSGFLTPEVFVLAYIREELLISFQITELVLSLHKLVVFVIHFLSKLLDSLLVAGGHLLVLFEILLLCFAFVAVANEPLVVFVDHFYHGILLVDELFLLLIKLLRFLNNFLFLRCETVINFSFFPLLLKKSDSLQRSLTLNNEGSNFV